MEKEKNGMLIPINIGIAICIYVMFLYVSGHSTNGVHESSLAASGTFKVSKELKVNKPAPAVAESKESH